MIQLNKKQDMHFLCSFIPQNLLLSLHIKLNPTFVNLKKIKILPLCNRGFEKKTVPHLVWEFPAFYAP